MKINSKEINMKTCCEIILNLARGKEVLDIGSCSNQGEMVKPQQLFNKIRGLAKSVTGVDLESNTPEIIKGNAETIKIKKKFDLVVAGDVIEHLHNVGRFLDNMHRHLKTNGLMVIVTPNVKAVGYLLFRGNKYHTCWYCRNTLKYLVEQHGFKVIKQYIGLRRRKSLLNDFLRTYLANNLLFICQKV